MSAAKWITGVLGWAFFGPIGGLVGFFLGKAIDSAAKGYVETYTPSPEGDRNSFLISLLVLSSVVMKADGKLMRSELNYIGDYIRANFGAEAVPQAMQWLKEILKQQVKVYEVSAQIRQHVNIAGRRQLLHYLAGIARADDRINANEASVLRQIAAALGLTAADAESALAMFAEDDLTSAYKILEVDPQAGDEEVKKAYKRMAVKHHPDKVAHLGADVQAAANEKFKRIAAAYEKIKKDRAMV